MIDNFNQKFSKLLKEQANDIKPDMSILENAIKAANVTNTKTLRYNQGKGRLQIINELMNQKIKVLLPLAAVVLIIAGGVALQRRASEPQTDMTQNNTEDTFQASGDPDKIYDQLVTDSTAEASDTSLSDSDWNQIDSYDQSVQQLNNAYDENQF